MVLLDVTLVETCISSRCRLTAKHYDEWCSRESSVCPAGSGPVTSADRASLKVISGRWSGALLPWWPFRRGMIDLGLVHVFLGPQIAGTDRQVAVLVLTLLCFLGAEPRSSPRSPRCIITSLSHSLFPFHRKESFLLLRQHRSMLGSIESVGDGQSCPEACQDRRGEESGFHSLK